jgi:hypothetical protein
VSFFYIYVYFFFLKKNKNRGISLKKIIVKGMFGPALPPGLKPKKKYDHATKTKRLNWVKIPANKVFPLSLRSFFAVCPTQ